MTVVLCDSIQVRPLPIARAIIPMAVTRLVTANASRENFSHSFVGNIHLASLERSPIAWIVDRLSVLGAAIPYSHTFDLKPRLVAFSDTARLI